MSKQKILWIIAMILTMSLVCVACHGLIAPVIGEGTVASNEGTEAQENPADVPGENGQEGGEGPGGPGEGGDNFDTSSSGGGDSEPVVAPVMVGNLVYHFHHEEMKSTSLGGTELFTVDADLFDEMNADGFNGAIHLVSGDSESYQTFVWPANEEGTLSLQLDEFNVFEAKEVDGVLTIVGYLYQVGMMNKGSVDVPKADVPEGYVPIGQGMIPGEGASEGGEGASEGGEGAPEGGAPEGGAPEDGEAPGDGGEGDNGGQP